MNNKKVAATWCRVSTDGQRELSLDSQELAVQKTLAAQSYETPPQYVLKVDWSSLDLMSCPEFQQLRQWIADGTVHAVGTLDRDRLQAQGLQRLIFLSECRDRGVPIITVQGAPMLEGGEGQLVELALALGKERSVLRAQQGARDGLRDRARLKGLPPNMAKPYGLRWENDRLVPDANYPIVCEIWGMALAGWGIRTIANELTRRGIPTPKGKPGWSNYSVHHILKNRTYTGIIEALKTESVEPKARIGSSYGKSGWRLRPESERIRLQGLVAHPIISETEYAWMQARFADNQKQSARNNKRRVYLLKQRIDCAACGAKYNSLSIVRRGIVYSYYICAGRSKKKLHGASCLSHTLKVDVVDQAVFSLVFDFLHSPGGFGSELQRRRGITAESAASLVRELESVAKQEKEEQETEARAFRLASRQRVSEEVFNQELGLIRTRQRWLAEQRERLDQQLADVQRYNIDPETVERLRQRLAARLKSASPGDRKFILDALNVRVVAQVNGAWELELQVPREMPVPADDLQIVNSRPGS
jgi:hypothetical protein